MINKKTWIVSSFLFILGASITFVLEKIFELKIIVNIKLGIIICVIITLVSVVGYLGYVAYITIKELKIENKTLHSKISKDNDILSIFDSEGNKNLLMALSQNIYEPLRVELLKISAHNYHNILAALILGDIYVNGIKKDGKYIVKPNIEDAYKLHLLVHNEDCSGVCDWILGWMFQNNIIGDAKKLTKAKRLEMARKYYESSADKGYPKAINSLGNFYKYGWGGLKKDETVAVEKYVRAANAKDPYAILNCGHNEMDKYEYKKDTLYLENAFGYFKQATEYNSSEGWLFLGIVFEEKAKENSSFLYDAKNCYLKSINNVRNQFSAAALYRLGRLIRMCPELQNDDDIKKALEPIKYNDLIVECFTKSYELFQELQSVKVVLSDKCQENFEHLVEGFKSIE
ncbi:MAG: sel1 repeat family protein [Clostridia bacterium]|nr:sel1 repeat family protein [Clostridia bacterium]